MIELALQGRELFNVSRKLDFRSLYKTQLYLNLHQLVTSCELYTRVHERRRHVGYSLEEIIKPAASFDHSVMERLLQSRKLHPDLGERRAGQEAGATFDSD